MRSRTKRTSRVVRVYLNPALDIPQRIQARRISPTDPNRIESIIVELSPGKIVELDELTASDLLSRTVSLSPTVANKSVLSKLGVNYTSGKACCGKKGGSLSSSLVIKEGE